MKIPIQVKVNDKIIEAYLITRPYLRLQRQRKNGKVYETYRAWIVLDPGHKFKDTPFLVIPLKDLGAQDPLKIKSVTVRIEFG